MRRVVALSCSAVAVIALACAGNEAGTADSSAAAAPPPAPSVTAADFAGTWTITTRNEAGDSVLVTTEMTATADMTGWTITLPNRPPMPATVITIGGDSVVTEAGPYESVLRKGVQVSTRSVMHLQNGMLRGMTTARYSNTNTADSVRNLPTEGVRKP
jgi:hypothetical protein